MSTLRDQFDAMALHVRDPDAHAGPPGIEARRLKIYSDLVYNNLDGLLAGNFPVIRKTLGDADWQALVRGFLARHHSHTPLFTELGRELIAFLESEPDPRRPWLAELAHYEWAELAVDIMDAPLPEHDPTGDLMLGRPMLNPARLDLSYNWPVHRIGTDYRPRRPQATQLVVYRDADLAVQFTEINPVTAHLLALLAPGQLTGEAALTQIATALQHPDPAQVLAFGRDLLSDLHRQGIILGSN